MSAETKEKIRQAKLGKPNPGASYVRTPETRERNRQGRLGKLHSDESKRKASQAHKATWANPEYRQRIMARDWTVERERLRLYQGAGRVPWSLESRLKLAAARRGRTLSAVTREKIRQANLGRKDSQKRRDAVRDGVVASYAARPEIKEKIRAARKAQVFPKRHTAIERLLADQFRELQLTFVQHRRAPFINHRPDFTFPDARLFVEADGFYWHNLTNVITRDLVFDLVADQNGWTVLRLSEFQIKQDAAACAAFVALHVQPPNGVNTVASAIPSY
jgi:very-short-patch-repair endonuclease